MKPEKKKRQGSMLTRFFKKTADKKANGPPAAPNKASPGRAVPAPSRSTAAKNPPTPPPAGPSPVERSIAEIKHLVAIGTRDPQRLALLVGNMLEAEKERQRADKEAFDQLLREIAQRGGKH